ncbi:regulatory protein RecX [Alterisphingorhabdus coralli]|uniref:Regulatory protein RecX n=1 Tax=Alterisphingorhabdus coralli TaxID=3071408 RepID=A0AA97F833_9SPHN|nr:RecX family transcriptional regulator [Parasphingorhabdus sp. SCSIO 66989]WOE75911.1 RecX family transcriptional regulator [Parasphingorhabdus sp. SCSIO 66989]
MADDHIENRRRGAMKKRAPRPLNAQKLRDMALRYVARYATSSHKLRQYLLRKVKERGWADDMPADVDALVDYCVAQRFINDALYAETKAASLSRRGYGKRRVDDSLRASGIDEEDAQGARDHAEAMRWKSALLLAKRRRIGPFAAYSEDAAERETEADAQQRQKLRQKQIQMMVRAGHDFMVAATLVDARNLERLREIGDEQLDIALDGLIASE